MSFCSKFLRIAFCAWAFFVSSPSYSRTSHFVDLGECLSEQVEYFQFRNVKRSFLDCTHITNRLRSGDLVHFSNGHAFTLIEKVGQGASAFLWTVKEHPGYVLRIPRGEQYDINALNDFKKGYIELDSLGVPAVEVLEPFSPNSEYVLVKHHNFVIKLDQFADSEWEEQPLPNENQLKTALTDFAMESFRLAETSNELQIGFDGFEWLVFDFTTHNKDWLSYDKKQNMFLQTPWKQYSLSSGDYFDQLHENVLSNRDQHCEAALIFSERALF